MSFMYSLTANNTLLVGSLVIVIMLLSYFSPYKQRFCNHLDILLLGTLAFLASSPWVLQAHNTEHNIPFDRYVLYIPCLIPVLYSLGLVIYCIWRRSEWVQSATERIRACFSRPSHRLFEQSLPRRVVMDEASALLRTNKNKP